MSIIKPKLLDAFIVGALSELARTSVVNRFVLSSGKFTAREHAHKRREQNDIERKLAPSSGRA